MGARAQNGPSENGKGSQQPRDVGNTNFEVVNEGKEGEAADKVHYPRRIGVFKVDNGYD